MVGSVTAAAHTELINKTQSMTAFDEWINSRFTTMPILFSSHVREQ